MMTTKAPSPSKTECLESVSVRKYIAFDFETTDFSPLDGDIVGVAIATDDGKWWFTEDDGKDILQLVANREDAWLIAHNMEFDYKWLRYKWGIDPKCQLVCTMILAWLLDENYKHYGLKHLVKRFFGHTMTEYEEVIARQDEESEDAPSMEEYAKEDAEYCLKLFYVLYGFVKDQELTRVFLKMEMPVCRFISDMEWTGIKISATELGDLRIQNRKEMSDLVNEIYDHCGKKFNIASSQQVGGILFAPKSEGGLGLPTEGITEKGKSGHYSTSSKVLKRLKKRSKNKIVDLLLRHRELSKFMDSFTEPFIELLRTSTDQRIHPSFHQVRTVTGRLSSSKPNFQQMPTKGNFRNVFVPDEGRIFIGVDFSQIELRVLAHLSKDKTMTETFVNGEDIHDTTRRLMGLPDDTQGRRVAKIINFGIVYGMGPEALSETAGISKRDAQKFIETFYDQYPGIGRYQQYLRGRLYKGYPLKLLTGRLRRVPIDGERTDYGREQAFRKYFNSAIQGGAADIMGISMRNLGEWMRDVRPEVKCLAQIHDELLFSLPETTNVYKIYQEIIDIMENVVELKVPIVADGYIGYRWMKQMVCPKCKGKYIDDEDGEEKVRELDLFEDINIEEKEGIKIITSGCCGATICRE